MHKPVWKSSFTPLQKEFSIKMFLKQKWFYIILKVNILIIFCYCVFRLTNIISALFLIKVHSNNMFSRGVKIFSSVSCWFKPNLFASWEAESVAFKTVLDDRNPSARYVTVPLNRRTAKSLRCRFYFADVWMMFSEISFQSGNTHSHTHTLKYIH